MKKLKTVKIPINLNLDGEIKKQFMQLINKHYLGDIYCNDEDGNTKYPKKETSEYKDATLKITAGRQINLYFDLYSDGSLVLSKKNFK